MAKMSGANFLTYLKRAFKRDDKDTELYEAITDIVMQIKVLYHFEEYKEEGYVAGVTVAGDYKMS